MTADGTGGACAVMSTCYLNRNESRDRYTEDTNSCEDFRVVGPRMRSAEAQPFILTWSERSPTSGNRDVSPTSAFRHTASLVRSSGPDGVWLDAKCPQQHAIRRGPQPNCLALLRRLLIQVCKLSSRGSM